MRRSIHPIKDFLAFLQILRLLRQVKPDIVHTHTAKAGALGRIAAILAGVPVKVHTFHGHVFTGYFSPWAAKIFLGIERFLAARTDCILTLTDTQKMEISAMGIHSKRGNRVVPLGLDLQRFFEVKKGKGNFRKELGLDLNTPLIGVIGRLVAIKRHGDLLQALHLLKEKGEPLHLAIVGGGEMEMELHHKVHEYGLEDWVHFCGFRQDLEEIFPSLDLVVLPSGNEGTPVCLIEAMACGIPIVATQVGGVPDLLSDCPSCIIVKPNHIQQLAEGVKKMLEQNLGKSEATQNHRAVILERYGIGKLVGSLKTLYQELLEPRQ